MNIKTVLEEIDVGVSNIEIEGKVTYEKSPRNITGDNERGHFDFWSQFVVIEDSTGKIGCNVSIEKEEYRLKKGVIARVKGKLESYKDKNGEVQKSLKGKLIGISEGGKTTDVELEVAEEYFDKKAKEEEKVKLAEKPASNIWEAKDLRIARECAVKAVTDLVCAKIMKSYYFFTFADTIVKYIYNGVEKQEESKADRIKKAREIVEAPGKVEVRDEDAPFPDEKITDEEFEAIEKAVNEQEENEEPGSSYDNAIPFQGRGKAKN